MDPAVEKRISTENGQDLTIPIIIPAYEPDGRLLDLLERLRELDMAPVIITDDGSGKDYRHIFQRAVDEYGAIVLRHDVNRGKGCALKTAFSYCLNQYDLLGGCITADSDGQHLPISILACRDALLKEKDSHRQGFNRMLLGALTLYYALFPVIPMLATQTVRDVMFSALLTYLMFLFYLLMCRPGSFMTSVHKPAGLGILLVLTVLSRNNNAKGFMLLAVLMMTCLVWSIYRERYFRGASIFAVVTVVSYVALNVLLTSLCQPVASNASGGAALSMFSQSVVRAFVMEQASWTEEEKARFHYFFPGEEISYVPENADPTKHKLVINKNMGEFLKFWLEIGLKHKRCYVDALLAQTKQMWFPGCVVDGYQKAGAPSYSKYDKCYYGFTDTIAEPGVHMLYMPRVRQFYKEIGLFLSFERIPVASMLFSIGFQFWVLLHCIFYVGYRRCRHLYLTLGILLCYMVGSAFVPLVLLRYFAAIFFAMPMVIAFTLQPTVMLTDQKGEVYQASPNCAWHR